MNLLAKFGVDTAENELRGNPNRVRVITRKKYAYCSLRYANNAGEGDWYGQGGNPAKQARYENPGLVNGEFIYNGFAGLNI